MLKDFTDKRREEHLAKIKGSNVEKDILPKVPPTSNLDKSTSAKITAYNKLNDYEKAFYTMTSLKTMYIESIKQSIILEFVNKVLENKLSVDIVDVKTGKVVRHPSTNVLKNIFSGGRTYKTFKNAIMRGLITPYTLLSVNGTLDAPKLSYTLGSAKIDFDIETGELYESFAQFTTSGGNLNMRYRIETYNEKGFLKITNYKETYDSKTDSFKNTKLSQKVSKKIKPQYILLDLVYYNGRVSTLFELLEVEAVIIAKNLEAYLKYLKKVGVKISPIESLFVNMFNSTEEYEAFYEIYEIWRLNGSVSESAKDTFSIDEVGSNLTMYADELYKSVIKFKEKANIIMPNFAGANQKNDTENNIMKQPETLITRDFKHSIEGYLSRIGNFLLKDPTKNVIVKLKEFSNNENNDNEQLNLDATAGTKSKTDVYKERDGMNETEATEKALKDTLDEDVV